MAEALQDKSQHDRKEKHSWNKKISPKRIRWKSASRKRAISPENNKRKQIRGNNLTASSRTVSNPRAANSNPTGSRNSSNPTSRKKINTTAKRTNASALNQSARGISPAGFSFLMTKIGYIGVDVGGTKTRLALFDASFKVLADVKLKTQDSRDANAFTTALNDALTVLIQKSRRFHLEIQNVGVGCAGSFNKDGSIKDAPNIPFLTGYSFRTVIAKHTGANVMVTNDVAAGLYGEHRLGAAIGRRHVIGIFIGTGVGGALIFDDKLYRGKNGSAGDIGHYVFHTTGHAPGSHSRFLDDVVSRTAIAEAVSELVYKKHAPYLAQFVGGNPEDITAGALEESIAHGDKFVEKLVRARCHILGVALSNLVDFLNPEMIVLGGGLSDKLPAIVRSEVEAGIRENSKQDPKRALEVVTAKLKGHAVTAGAAKLSADIALSLIAA